VGHALGFFHVTDEDAVMFPTFPRRTLSQWHADDA
jgi:hypothetical protein